MHDPSAIYKFEEHEVVIPIFVIEEVDQFKKELSELGRNARTFARKLDELRDVDGTSLQAGVEINDVGGVLKVVVSGERPHGGHGAMDSAILKSAIDIAEARTDCRVVLVTMDTNLRIRADAHGLRAETYEGGRIDIDELFSGIITLDVSPEAVNRLAKRDPVPIDPADFPDQHLHPNAGIVLRDRAQPRHTALGVYVAPDEAVVPLCVSKQGCWGVRPRNLEQYFALDLLLRPGGPPRDARRQGGHGQDPARHRRGAAVRHGRRQLRQDAGEPPDPSHSARTWATCPAPSKRSSTRGCSRSTTTSSCILGAGPRQDTSERPRPTSSSLERRAYVEIEPLTYIRGRSLPNQSI